MEQFYFTKIGQKYAAKTATGSIMEFTIGKFGDGIPVAEPMDLTDLVSPLGELFIFKKTSEGNQVVVQTQFTNVINGEILPAFHLKEIGLFAKLRTADGKEDKDNPETLVAYAHVMGDDYGDYIPNTPTEFIINWPFQISNSQNVSVNVGLMSYALQKDFEELKETVESKPHVAVVYR
ncbi:MAG: hypothetical protein Q4G33_04660, partial [bacterium]|nr:hypothetical protein [bacterium]